MGLFDLFKRKNTPTPNREAIIQNTFKSLDTSLKSAAIAQIGGFRPSEDPLTSRFSGDFVMKEGEDWPVYNGNPLQSFLQVNIAELPFVPEALQGLALMTVFVDQEDIPFDQPNGNGWLIRTYKDLEGLAPRKNPVEGSWIKPFEIRWSLSEEEGPQWEDAWEVTDLKEFNALEDSTDLFYDRYENHAFTKIGGWPNLIQHELDMGPENFIFQIGSEEKANWNWVDSGNAYFGKVNGEWVFECQFY